jgi:competence protein ComEA
MLEPAKRPLWGWTLPARILLTVIAGCGALGLSLAAPASAPSSATTLPSLVVDVNSAPPAVLAALPRLGPSLVGRIAQARAVRPFRSVDELDTRVHGIGPATIAALRPYLRVESSAR